MIIIPARIFIAIWIAVAICAILAALARILGKLVALVCYGLAYVLDALAWLWRQARWSA